MNTTWNETYWFLGHQGLHIGIIVTGSHSTCANSKINICPYVEMFSKDCNTTLFKVESKELQILTHPLRVINILPSGSKCLSFHRRGLYITTSYAVNHLVWIFPQCSSFFFLTGITWNAAETCSSETEEI